MLNINDKHRSASEYNSEITENISICYDTYKTLYKNNNISKNK
jgi:hypothetical protein